MRFTLSFIARLTPRSAPVARDASLSVEELESREVPATMPDFAAVGMASQPVYLATGSGSGGGDVRVFDFQSQKERFHLTPFGPNYTGGVSVAVGDVNGDGTPDIICASGIGAITTIRVYDGVTGTRIASFEPFGPNYTSGASVAVGDFNGDGKGDIVVGGTGHDTIKVFSGASLGTATPVMLARFHPFGTGISAGYVGGVRVATGDVSGDGSPDILAVTATGRAIVAGFDGTAIGNVNPFQPFSPYYATGGNSTGGGWISAADVNGDGYADIATSSGSGNAVVRIIDGKTLPLGGNPTLIGRFTLTTSAADGARVHFLKLSTTEKPDLVVSANTGEEPTVGIFSTATNSLLTTFNAEPTNFLGGISVG